jgi:hypothetical protein
MSTQTPTATIVFRYASSSDFKKNRLFSYLSGSKFSGCQIDFRVPCGGDKCLACTQSKSIRAYTHTITYGVDVKEGVSSWVDSSQTNAHYVDESKFCLVQIPIGSKKQLMDLFSQQLHKPLDTYGAAWSLLPCRSRRAAGPFTQQQMKERKKWVCSELIATALFVSKTVDPTHLDARYQDPSKITPQMLFELLDSYFADESEV